MSEDTGPAPSRLWKLSTLLFAFLFVAIAGWCGIEHQRADQAAASLQTAVEQLESVQSHLNDAQLQLQETQRQLADATKPVLPITVSFHKSLSGSGLVGVFRNSSVSPLEISAVFSSPATGGKRAANLVIPANGVKEIGHVEGWPFAAGQHIQLTNHQYKGVEYDVPGT
jgi:hypothetical protein